MRKVLESPETDESILRLRRRGSMGDLTASPFTPDPKKTFSLPELMKKGLQDPIIVKDDRLANVAWWLKSEGALNFEL